MNVMWIRKIYSNILSQMYIEHGAQNRIEKHYGTESGSGKSFNEKLHILQSSKSSLRTIKPTGYDEFDV